MKKLVTTVVAGLLAVGAVGCLAGCGEENPDKSGQGLQVNDVKEIRGKVIGNSSDIVILSNAGLQSFLEEYPTYADDLNGYSIEEGESLLAISCWRSTSSEKDFGVRKLYQNGEMALNVQIDYFCGEIYNMEMMPLTLFIKTENLSLQPDAQGLLYSTFTNIRSGESRESSGTIAHVYI
ncbi:MAG: hypothetical protein K2H43_05275 [Clostridia bacterium]|nr:hypothetical protein [Clostridia bacterium]